MFMTKNLLLVFGIFIIVMIFLLFIYNNSFTEACELSGFSIIDNNAFQYYSVKTQVLLQYIVAMQKLNTLIMELFLILIAFSTARLHPTYPYEKRLHSFYVPI